VSISYSFVDSSPEYRVSFIFTSMSFGPFSIGSSYVLCLLVSSSLDSMVSFWVFLVSFECSLVELPLGSPSKIWKILLEVFI
jgi:hypothetical protein